MPLPSSELTVVFSPQNVTVYAGKLGLGKLIRNAGGHRNVMAYVMNLPRLPPQEMWDFGRNELRDLAKVADVYSTKW